jgi:collagen type VII alpha
MAFDSLIKLRQINQAELTGFVQRVVPYTLSGSGFSLTGTHIIPTTSGSSDLGGQSLPFREIYAKEINLPSNSGIWFGQDFFTAYTSGNQAVVKVGSYSITTTGNLLAIIGPSGQSGVGFSGASGVSGISITGASGINSTGVKFLLSNGTLTNSIFLPSGATGATGIGLTGFRMSGLLTMLPLFNNGTTGSGITIPSGQRGLQGVVGGVRYDFSDFTGITGDLQPKAYVYNIDEQGNTYNPNIYLIKGLSYNFGYSGLNLTGVTITGNGVDYATGSFRSNYFVESGITGYLKFALFDPTVTGLYSNPKTGRYIRQEILGVGGSYADVIAKVVTDTNFYNISETVNRGELDFNVKLSATANLKYGFQKYNFFTQSAIDSLGSWGFYVLGDVYNDFYGRTGQPGAQGAIGQAGAQGERGLRGLDGADGASITGIIRSFNDIAFQLSNGTITSYITLPTGGPSGATGPAGSTGPSGATGPTGPIGPSGLADRYATSFDYQDTYYNGTGQAMYKRVSGSSTWNLVTGTGRRFTAGDEISFYNNGLTAKSYTTYQKLIFADTPYTRGQYFYGDVTSYNSSNGLISVIVSSSPAPLGDFTGQIRWDNYALIQVNLGGLGSQGPQGVSGASVTGAQGPIGNTGNQVFVINTPTSGLVAGSNTLKFSQYDAWDLSFTGNNNQIYFDYSTFSTGQTVILRLYNSGAVDNLNTGPVPLVNWETSYIKFPYNVSAPAPNPGEAAMYTFLRFPDTAAGRRVYCTYSTSYPA